MGRIRSVHPDICESAALAAVSASAERTFVRLWTICDDEGRCKAEPRLLKAKLYPLHDNVSIDDVMSDMRELSSAGLVMLYTVENVSYLVVPGFADHQHPNRPTASKLPPPPERSSRPHPCLSESSLTTQTSHEPSHSGVGVGVGVGEGEHTPETPSRRTRKQPIPLSLEITASLERWGAEHGFDALDMAAEARRMLDYHRSQGKLSADWPASLRTWLGRDKRYQDHVIPPEAADDRHRTDRRRDISRLLAGHRRAADPDLDEITRLEGELARLEAS